jgi:hypothetical protein
MTNKRYGGKLENWKVVDWCKSTGETVVYGNLYNDPAQRFLQGAVVRTSSVIHLDYENMKLDTANTIYDLGVELGEGQ